MELLDSRRLTGINVVSDVPGAVVDVALDDAEAALAIGVWLEEARGILTAVGWGDEQTFTREFTGGASLQISAPIDGWYAACEVNEWAWASTVATLTGADVEPMDEAAPRLRALIEAESNPRLIALHDAAAARGVAFHSDDERASVGVGRGSRCWPVNELPGAEEVDWDAVHDVPVVLITGTNGKTTTTRLLARMVAASGAVPGNTSSDGVQIDGKTVLAGDYTGGEGARAVLQDDRVDVAILEVARGGLLRRGVPVAACNGALVTNVGRDHLGEFGVADVDELADTKMLVTRAVVADGRVVLNADDPALVARSHRVSAPTVWYAMSRANDTIQARMAAGDEVFFVRDRSLMRVQAGKLTEIIGIDEIPIAMQGAARHNLENALGATALAAGLGLAVDEIAAGLRGLRGDATDNPGRGNLFSRDGVRIFADFAHNPPGMRAIVEMANAVPAERRLILLGQAGDRDDESIRALARAAWEGTPDRVIIKEMPHFLRGREPGEIPALLSEELVRCGAAAGAIDVAASELDGVEKALAWARPGDLLLLLLQERESALAHLQEIAGPGWDDGTRADGTGADRTIADGTGADRTIADGTGAGGTVTDGTGNDREGTAG